MTDLSAIESVLRGEQRWTVEHCSMLDLLPLLPENSVDSCVCDPPYELNFGSRGWDRSGISFQPDTWLKVLRVLKPGGHLLAFGGTRTFHRIACAIEDGGFRVRDSIAWMHSQGFPKSVSLGNGLGTALKPSFEPIIVARRLLDGTLAHNFEHWGTGGLRIDDCRIAHASAEDRAAHEAQVAAIKARGGSMDGSWKNASDLSGANDVNDAGRWPPNTVLSHHSDCVCLGTRTVAANPTWDTPNRDTEPSAFTGDKVSKVRHATRVGEPSAERRYSERGVTGFAALPGERRDDVEEAPVWNCVEGCAVRILEEQGETGASRYFAQFQADDTDLSVPLIYQSKPSSSERDEGLGHFQPLTGGEATGRKDGSAGVNNPRAGAGRTGGRRNPHATVKSRDLMRYLVRLVTPKNGVCLDPFTGSGTTGVACMLEGVRFIGFELNDTDKEPFVRIARARIANAVGFDEHASPVLHEDKKTGLQQMSLFNLGAKTK